MIYHINDLHKHTHTCMYTHTHIVTHTITNLLAHYPYTHTYMYKYTCRWSLHTRFAHVNIRLRAEGTVIISLLEGKPMETITDWYTWLANESHWVNLKQSAHIALPLNGKNFCSQVALQFAVWCRIFKKRVHIDSGFLPCVYIWK